ncbi:TonB family protein [Hymenobacter sp. HMF4947]|uniref:TonB family protein n=1 Tax=Hymenobacter ginkgonis TaxID=2682976 RepID=A0A7K1TC01_9BACT|nr:energy transducer TonB [Hymenobacter ginkgonis]MVN75936.1 TonB family protein [Hymenobacter ginkgonis]
MQNFTRLVVVTWLLATSWLVIITPAKAQKLRETKYEHGMLDKNQKIGVWEYYGYTPSGEKVVVQRYDHAQKQLLYFRPGAEVLYHAEIGPGQWKYVRPDRPPLFIGSDAALATYTAKLVYPELALARNIQGKVLVAFTIDTLGHTTGHHLVQRIGGGCDEEAMRIARTVPDQWVPARIGTRAVAVEYELPLNFKLQ